jgi:hypothetical protein
MKTGFQALPYSEPPSFAKRKFSYLVNEGGSYYDYVLLVHHHVYQPIVIFFVVVVTG